MLYVFFGVIVLMLCLTVPLITVLMGCFVAYFANWASLHNDDGALHAGHFTFLWCLAIGLWVWAVLNFTTQRMARAQEVAAARAALKAAAAQDAANAKAFEQRVAAGVAKGLAQFQKQRLG